MNSSNKHLKSKIKEISNFTSTHNNPPEDLFDSFILELKVSRLYIPATAEGDEIVFEHLESDEGIMVLPLFTTPEEYDGDNELRSYEFDLYAEIIEDCDFAGAVINPNSDDIFIPKSTTEELRVKALPKVNEDEIYDAYELKDIASTIKNEALMDFICDESNFNNFDGLIDILADSVLLNVVSSSNDLSELSHDGIITALEVGGFNLSIKRTFQEKYGLLFTSLDKITDTCDTDAGLYYYYQITSFDKILEFILKNDLDGLILNPYLEDYYVPRNVLLDIYENHPEIMYNPKYMGGTFYAFTL